eukprot:scaffold1336_cov379-Prasinococcus_capsulatus_cf.AAC.5
MRQSIFWLYGWFLSCSAPVVSSGVTELEGQMLARFRGGESDQPGERVTNPAPSVQLAHVGPPQALVGSRPQSSLMSLEQLRSPQAAPNCQPQLFANSSHAHSPGDSACLSTLPQRGVEACDDETYANVIQYTLEQWLLANRCGTTAAQSYSAKVLLRTKPTMHGETFPNQGLREYCAVRLGRSACFIPCSGGDRNTALFGAVGWAGCWRPLRQWLHASAKVLHGRMSEQMVVDDY